MKKVHVLLSLFFSLGLTYAQDLKQIVPPNPDVASLFKSVITPVTEYSGLPNVNVPLYTLQEGGISIPLSLSYATGGIQVSEESGHVGLGWALNAGGAITRSINGGDDFALTYGYLIHNEARPDIPPERDPVNNAWRPDTHAFLSSTETGIPSDDTCAFDLEGGGTKEYPFPVPEVDDYDFMPDLFHFNFNGYSGSFVFKKGPTSNSVFLLNKKDVYIELVPNATSGISDDAFQVITEDGTIYDFAKLGYSDITEGINAMNYVSTWYLTRITDIYGNYAEFKYDIVLTTTPFRSYNQSWEATVGGASSYSANYRENYGPKTDIDDHYLTSITTYKRGGLKTQEAVFNYSDPTLNPRKDMNARYLESIDILDANSVVINTYDLSFSYFGIERTYNASNVSTAKGDYAAFINALASEFPDINLRLKLDSIVENGISKHSFEYFEGNNIFPNKTSFSQDYWGFYNSVYNPESFIPELNSKKVDLAQYDQPKKANRLPNEEACKLFSLKKITYPTGGSTEFEYELNTFDFNGNFNDTPTATVPKYERISAHPGLNNNSVIIRPNQGSDLHLSFSITLRGWNGTMSSTPPTVDFALDFYARLSKIDGSVVHSFVINQDNTNQWNSFTAADNASMNAVITENESGYWSYDINTTNQLTEDEYLLEVGFDDKNGLLYGTADIHAQWEDVELGDTKEYSIGGGLRVASISEYDSDGQLETKRAYNYHYFVDDNGTQVEKSYGKIKSQPNFAINRTSIYNMNTGNSNPSAPWGHLPVVLGAASSQNSFSKDAGSYVGYDQVEIRSVSYETDPGTQQLVEVDNGKTTKTFVNQPDHFRSNLPLDMEDDYHKYPPIRVPHNGLLKSEVNYKDDGITKVSETINTYKINGIEDGQFNIFTLYENTDRVISANKELPVTVLAEAGSAQASCDDFLFQMYPYYSNLIQQIKTEETIYDTNGNKPVTTVQEFKYDSPAHYQRTETKLTNSKGEELKTKILYPDDVINSTSLGLPNISTDEFNVINRLKSFDLHRVAEAVQTETTVNGEKSIQRSYYADWDGDTSVLSDRIWPEFVKTLKGDASATGNSIQDRIKYLEYDAYGNPLEVAKEGGASIVYLWGYNHKYPIAKIENANYTNISAALITAAENASDLDDDRTMDTINSGGSITYNGDEGALRDALNDIRVALPGSMVTTYTYDPLIGVTSVTDPRGYTLYYSYDTANRLVEVRDADQKLVTDYEYHYKGQSSN